jgi:hypothetical protein
VTDAIFLQESSVVEDVDIPGVYLTLDGENGKTIAVQLKKASERLRRSAGKAKQDGLADPAMPAELSGVPDDDNVVSLEVLLEALVWRYGAAAAPGWIRPCHTFCSMVVIPLVMPTTRVITGQYAYGETHAEKTIYSMMHFAVAFMIAFNGMMTMIMACDFRRRANMVDALGQMIDVGLDLNDLLINHPKAEEGAEEEKKGLLVGGVDAANGAEQQHHYHDHHPKKGDPENVLKPFGDTKKDDGFDVADRLLPLSPSLFP